MGEVINFRPHISEEFDSTGLIDQVIKEVNPTLSITTKEETSYEAQIETKNLYPLSHELRPELAAAFTLIKEGLENVDEAIKAEKEGDRISSDDAIQRLQALLPELFCCRSISDGFGSIINAVHHAIVNMQVTPLNSDQLLAIRKVMRRINTEPFLEFGEAVDEIISLENVGFEVEPSYYKYAADMLDD